LEIGLFEEHWTCGWQALPQMTRGDDGWYRLPEAQRDLLPLMYSLRAVKPGGG